MSTAVLLEKEKLSPSKAWRKAIVIESKNQTIPLACSAFPRGFKELCESKVHFICGPGSLVVSG